MFNKKLNNYSEKDFVMLRAPLESGRQAPSRLALTLLFGILSQLLMGLCVYISADPVAYPGYYKVPIMICLYIFVGMLIVLSILFSVPYI